MVTLVAAFDPETASVQLTVDGSTWATVPATVTVTRQASGEASETVRGLIGKAVVGGYLVATDHEMPLGASVTYTIVGMDSSGTSLASASASVATTVTATGVWVKAPGRPDLSILCQPASLGEITSTTVGGVYQVLGGEGVAVAQYSGVAPESFQLVLRTDKGADTDSLRKLLKDYRVVLLQPVGVDDMDPGWYFTGQANRSNPGGFNDFAFRYTTLTPVASRVPAGSSGGSVWTYAALADTYATYDDVKAAFGSYFALAQGPS